MGDPTSTLLGFIHEMNEWELACARRYEDFKKGSAKPKENRRIGMESYARIFATFCAEGRAKPRDFHFSMPPEYDDQELAIVETAKLADHIAITVQQKSGLKDKYLFRLVEQGGAWKILNREYIINGKHGPLQL
jgi:hypothetical protein